MELPQIILLLAVCLYIFLGVQCAGKLFNQLQWYLYRDLEHIKPMTPVELCVEIGIFVVSCTLTCECVHYGNVLIGDASGL